MKNSRLFSGFTAITATVEMNFTFIEDPWFRCRLAFRTLSLRGKGPEAWSTSNSILTILSLLDRAGPRSRGPVGARRSRRLLSLRDTARAMSRENVEIVRQANEAFNR